MIKKTTLLIPDTAIFLPEVLDDNSMLAVMGIYLNDIQQNAKKIKWYQWFERVENRVNRLFSYEKQNARFFYQKLQNLRRAQTELKGKYKKLFLNQDDELKSLLTTLHHKGVHFQNIAKSHRAQLFAITEFEKKFEKARKSNENLNTVLSKEAKQRMLQYQLSKLQVGQKINSEAALKTINQKINKNPSKFIRNFAKKSSLIAFPHFAFSEEILQEDPSRGKPVFSLMRMKAAFLRFKRWRLKLRQSHASVNHMDRIPRKSYLLDPTHQQHYTLEAHFDGKKIQAGLQDYVTYTETGEQDESLLKYFSEMCNWLDPEKQACSPRACSAVLSEMEKNKLIQFLDEKHLFQAQYEVYQQHDGGYRVILKRDFLALLQHEQWESLTPAEAGYRYRQKVSRAEAPFLERKLQQLGQYYQIRIDPENPKEYEFLVRRWALALETDFIKHHPLTAKNYLNYFYDGCRTPLLTTQCVQNVVFQLEAIFKTITPQSEAAFYQIVQGPEWGQFYIQLTEVGKAALGKEGLVFLASKLHAYLPHHGKSALVLAEKFESDQRRISIFLPLAQARSLKNRYEDLSKRYAIFDKLETELDINERSFINRLIETPDKICLKDRETLVHRLKQIDHRIEIKSKTIQDLLKFLGITHISAKQAYVYALWTLKTCLQYPYRGEPHLLEQALTKQAQRVMENKMMMSVEFGTLSTALAQLGLNPKRLSEFHKPGKSQSEQRQCLENLLTQLSEKIEVLLERELVLGLLAQIETVQYLKINPVVALPASLAIETAPIHEAPIAHTVEVSQAYFLPVSRSSQVCSQLPESRECPYIEAPSVFMRDHSSFLKTVAQTGKENDESSLSDDSGYDSESHQATTPAYSLKADSACTSGFFQHSFSSQVNPSNGCQPPKHATIRSNRMHWFQASRQVGTVQVAIPVALRISVA